MNVALTTNTIRIENGAGTIFYQLSGGAVTYSPNLIVFQIALTLNDLNGLKETEGTGTSSINTYLSVLAALASDVFGNSLVPIVTGSAGLVVQV